MNTADSLRQLFASRYTTRNLVGVSPTDFRRKIDSFLAIRDHQDEGYADPSKQRDLSIQFHWGHDHDFGDFKLSGRMGERHISLIANFIDQFGLPRDLTGKRILDIGCWTGGTVLLLSAMGAEVFGIEEVSKYVESTNYLLQSFGLSRATVRNLSLYELGQPEFYDQFDYVLFAGVLYHVTDPVLALRHLFNALKDGGTCFVETHGFDAHGTAMQYEGPKVVYGDPSSLSRGGWNWFFFTPATVEQMLYDVGFAEVKTSPLIEWRINASARREKHVDLLRAGLSVPNVR